MNKKKYLTVVKQKGKITKKKTEDNVIDNKLITFILLCDMPGNRMKSYGSTSLIELHGKRLIDIQIEAIKTKFKNYEIIICCGFDSENVYKYIRTNYKKDNIRVVENQIFNNSNSCESLRLCLNNLINTKVFIVDGSLVFKSTIFDNISLDKSFVMIEKAPSENLEIGVNINEYDFVEYLSFGAKYIWSEILFLSEDKIIDSLRKLLGNIDYKNKFIFEALNDIITMKHNISYVKNTYQIQKINNIKTYKNLKRM